jgi:hypothetical protein
MLTMDQAYKYMTSTYLTLNNTKDIIENLPKIKKYNLEERKSHHQTSMREKMVLVHSLLERETVIRGGSLGY